MQNRCVKFLDSHGPGMCQKIDRINNKVECVNSGGDHTANYKGCPNYTAAKTAKPKKVTLVKPGVSYANALSGVSKAPPTTEFENRFLECILPTT